MSKFAFITLFALSSSALAGDHERAALIEHVCKNAGNASAVAFSMKNTESRSWFYDELSRKVTDQKNLGVMKHAVDVAYDVASSSQQAYDISRGYCLDQYN